MYATQSAEHSLNLPCRKISAVSGDSLHHRFLVGTYILPTPHNPTPNEIHLLRFHEDMNELGTDRIFAHRTGEVLECLPHPSNVQLFFTAGTQTDSDNISVSNSKCVVWKMPPPPEDDYYGEEEEEEAEEEDSNFENSHRNTNTYLDASSRTVNLEPVSYLPISDQTQYYKSLWTEEEEDASQLLTLTSSTSKTLQLSQWDISTEQGINLHERILPSSHPRGRMANHPTMASDPHNPHLLAVCHGSTISLHDLRTSSSETSPQLSDSQQSQSRPRSRSFHRYNITDLDYNPNRPHIIVTGGDDGLLKFWDLRHSSIAPSSDYEDAPLYPSTSFHSTSSPFSPSNVSSNIYSKSKSKSYSKARPLKVCQGGHSHHITSVKYNPFHDPLILSSGSDSMVNLWRISSISSSPMMEFTTTTSLDKDDDEEEDPLFSSHEDSKDPSHILQHQHQHPNQEDGPDIRVVQVEHPESVYDVAWSKCDAWVWASVGLDGGVLLHHVPSDEKYKILL